MATKKELIQKYNEGLLMDSAHYGFSYYDGLTIVDIVDGEAVFGYYESADSTKKEFFLRKIYFPIDEKKSPFFIWNGQRYKLNEFTRSFF